MKNVLSKKLVLIVAVLSVVQARAQVFTTSLTSQGWAGGQCCSYGVNYSLTITGNAAELEKLVVKSLCIDQHILTLYQNAAVVKTGSSAYRIFTFMYSVNQMDIVPYKNIENSSATCTDEGRVYLENNAFLMVESRTELEYIAYP